MEEMDKLIISWMINSGKFDIDLKHGTVARNKSSNNNVQVKEEEIALESKWLSINSVHCLLSL